MDITPKEATIVQNILNKHLPTQTKVWIFGSRVTKAKKQFSDLDLAIDNNNKLELSVISSLEYDFSESDLPYKVDIVDLNNINTNFRNQIMSKMSFFWEKKL